jgi:hypothetical protein
LHKSQLWLQLSSVTAHVCPPINYEDFHNIAFLLLFATAAALVLRLAGMRLGNSFLFAGFGVGAQGFGKGWLPCQGYRF